MSDKEKRKRRPSRRRLIVILITLILLCLAGGIVLTPQINAWLATDPFTPQCHFEEDRLFATGNPMVLHSINSTDEDIQLDPEYFMMDWSPDGQYIATMKPAWNGRNQLDVLTIDGEVVFSTIADIYLESPDNWSPDGRYLRYFITNGVTLGKYLYIFDTQSMDIAYLTPAPYVDFSWSPNGKYLFLAKLNLPQNDKDGLLSWSIVDLDNRTTLERGTYSFQDVNKFSFDKLGWSNDSDQYYFIQNGKLIRHDAVKQQLDEILELTLDEQISVTDIHTQQIVIIGNLGTVIVIDLETKEINRHKGIIGRNSPIAWIPNNHNFLYYKLATNNIDNPQLALLNFDDLSTEIIDDMPVNDALVTTVSPGGHYILYLYASEKFTWYVYDLESGKKVPNGEFWLGYAPRWIQMDGKSYVVISEDTDNFDEYLTYLWNPETSQRCKIGITGRELSFQPQPAR